MAEEGSKASRYVCKLCCKKFPCGKSLECHIRSHLVINSADFEEKVELSMNKSLFLNESKLAESVNGQTSYGLRENPKKTWRAVDARPLPQENVCKQCGKGFQSMKALCGHMACHSDKDKGTATKDDHDHDYSWTSENQKMVLDDQSNTETEEMRLRTRSYKSRKCKKIAEDSLFVLASNGGGSSVSEIDGQEQEEVAKCLMMLSRDSGSKGGVNSVVESSDNNSVVVETKSSSIEMKMDRKGRVGDHVLNQCLLVEKNEPSKLGDSVLDGETAKREDSDSGYFLAECVKGESDVSVGWFRRYDDDHDGMASKIGGLESRKRSYGYENQESPRTPQKKSKYECFNCKKVFKSYQALGGHRPCNKRVCELRDESGENSPDDAAYYRTNTKFVDSSSKRKLSAKSSPQLAENKNKNKNKAHACPFCDRVFKNGQALGGHKRSHFLTGHVESSSRTSPVEKPDLLDLNIPAPEADEDDEGGGGYRAVG